MAVKRKRKGASRKVVVINGSKRRRHRHTVGKTHHKRRRIAGVGAVGHLAPRRRRKSGVGKLNTKNIFKTGVQIVGGVAVGAYGTHFVFSPLINWVGANFPALSPVVKIAKSAAGVGLVFMGKGVFMKSVGAGILASEQIVGATSKFIPGLSGIGDGYSTLMVPSDRSTLAGLLNNGSSVMTPQVSGLMRTAQVAGLNHTAMVSGDAPPEPQHVVEDVIFEHDMAPMARF
jgi:hypothetical protein